MASAEDIKKAEQRLAVRSGTEEIFDLMGPLRTAFQKQNIELQLGLHNPTETVQH